MKTSPRTFQHHVNIKRASSDEWTVFGDVLRFIRNLSDVSFR